MSCLKRLDSFSSYGFIESLTIRTVILEQRLASNANHKRSLLASIADLTEVRPVRLGFIL